MALIIIIAACCLFLESRKEQWKTGVKNERILLMVSMLITKVAATVRKNKGLYIILN